MIGLPTQATGFQSDNPLTTPVDQTYSRMLQRESGDRQFNANGQPVTGSSGEIGIGQILPSTGPEAARLAGLGWDPNRFANDAGYNKALGQAYYEHQLKTFGSPNKAAAAYNAGPGRVQEAIAKGGDAWLSYVPQSTQEYVKAVTGAEHNGVADSDTPKPESTPGTAPGTTPGFNPNGLYTVMMLRSMFPQHSITPVDYDPFAVMPKGT